MLTEEKRRKLKTMAQLVEERDLLASRLCAIAFEAGMNWRRLGHAFAGEDFFTVLVDVALTKEEVK